MKTLQTFTLVAATITTGLMAGLFAAFAYAVMPGLARDANRSYVESMQHINDAILNPVFMLCFMGAFGLIALGAVLAWRGHDRATLPWLVLALVLYAATFVVTSAVDVPLNDELARAGNPNHIRDLDAVRDAFHTPWVISNAVRALLNLAAFGALAWALVVFGRVTGGRRTPSAAVGPPATVPGPGPDWASLQHGQPAATPHGDRDRVATT
jgi:uncharacterized membrane protein